MAGQFIEGRYYSFLKSYGKFKVCFIFATYTDLSL